jgi:DNA polymerase I
VLGNHGVTLRGIVDDTHAGVLRTGCGRQPTRPGLACGAPSRLQDHQLRGRCRQGRETAAVQPGRNRYRDRYAAEDADVTLQLHEALWPKLAEDEGLKYVYEEIEMPLVPVLARIERHGVLVDADMLRAQSEELGRQIEAVEHQAYETAGETFNLASPKQIQEILFERRPAGAAEDAQGPALDRRIGAAGTRRSIIPCRS